MILTVLFYTQRQDYPMQANTLDRAAVPIQTKNENYYYCIKVINLIYKTKMDMIIMYTCKQQP